MRGIIVVFMMVCSISFGAGGLADDVMRMILGASDEVVEETTKRSAKKALEKGIIKYGDDAVRVSKLGGIELLEASVKYGDEIIELAIKNPNAIKALATNGDEVLKLTKKYGEKVLDLEAFRPGFTRRLYEEFGDDGVRRLINKEKQRELSKLLGYAGKAEDEYTKKLLYENYLRGGSRFLEKLDYKKIMAVGLTSSMIVGVNNSTKGVPEAMVAAAESNPEVIGSIVSEPINTVIKPFKPAIIFFTFVLAIMHLIKIGNKMFKKEK